MPVLSRFRGLLMALAIAGCTGVEAAPTAFERCLEPTLSADEMATVSYADGRTTVRTPTPDLLTRELAEILDAQLNGRDEPISTLPVGTPTLQVEASCDGPGPCVPDEVSLLVSRAAVTPVWSGTGEVTFRVDSDAFRGAPVTHHAVQRGARSGLHYVLETVEVRLPYPDYIIMACSGRIAFSYEDLEGVAHTGPLRGFLQAIEFGHSPLAESGVLRFALDVRNGEEYGRIH